MYVKPGGKYSDHWALEGFKIILFLILKRIKEKSRILPTQCEGK